jgi:hypothetical protein
MSVIDVPERMIRQARPPNERHLVDHQGADKGPVARQPVEFGDYDRPLSAGGLDGGGEFRAGGKRVGALAAALDLDILAGNGEVLLLAELSDSLALRLHRPSPLRPWRPVRALYMSRIQGVISTAGAERSFK